ncbi:MAG TPA: thiamine phosphate synthase, partial [Bacteroidetes bacterium]|nr:thiamine phosphate synthase [Bacteroidota bacterium]
DMLGLGPVFLSTTKDVQQPLGCAMLKEVLMLRPSKPIWAIGGIGPAEAGELRTLGWHRVAVSAALMDADHPTVAARLLVDLLA